MQYGHIRNFRHIDTKFVMCGLSGRYILTAHIRHVVCYAEAPPLYLTAGLFCWFKLVGPMGKSGHLAEMA